MMPEPKYHVWTRWYVNTDVAFDEPRPEQVEARVSCDTRKPYPYHDALLIVRSVRAADDSFEPRLGLSDVWMVPA